MKVNFHIFSYNDVFIYLNIYQLKERHLGKFIWTHDSIFSSDNVQENMVSRFKQKIECLVSAQTSFVNDAKETFDKNLGYIRDDMDSVFALINNRTDELFHD